MLFGEFHTFLLLKSLTKIDIQKHMSMQVNHGGANLAGAMLTSGSIES